MIAQPIEILARWQSLKPNSENHHLDGGHSSK